MKCPHCHKEIKLDLHTCASAMGKIGGKLSKRKLTTEQAKAMAEAKKLKKLQKLYGLV